MENKKLKLYFDWNSQPSRAIISFCRINLIPVELQEVRIGKRQHFTEEFRKINPAQAVPVLAEVDMKTNEVWYLFESNAILRYLCEKFKVADHWYPKDPVKRALVN